MSTLLHLLIAYVLVAGAALFFIVCLCVASRDGDEQADEARRREFQERAARSEIYGPPWRGR